MASTRLTVDEVLAHPGWEKAEFYLNLSPSRSGTLPVAIDRGGPVNISWETHGHGPIHILFIMGLGAYKSGWQRQCQYFGHQKGDQYTCLVFDNRGMGQSDKPLTRYSTSEMAKDALELCDNLGWTGPRGLHVIGISMGGCIAQEVAYLVPDRVASLSLLSTYPRLVRTTGFIENLRNRINMFVPKEIDVQMDQVKRQIFSDEWLTKPDEQLGLFPTNGDWFTAAELNKRMDTAAFSKIGFLMQAVACGWHVKSDVQLKQIGDQVGRDRIQIIVGELDRMVAPIHSDMLLSAFGGPESGVTFTKYEGVSHVPTIERRKECMLLLEKLVQKGEKLRDH